MTLERGWSLRLLLVWGSLVAGSSSSFYLACSRRLILSTSLSKQTSVWPLISYFPLLLHLFVFHCLGWVCILGTLGNAPFMYAPATTMRDINSYWFKLFPIPSFMFFRMFQFSWHALLTDLPFLSPLELLVRRICRIQGLRMAPHHTRWLITWLPMLLLLLAMLLKASATPSTDPYFSCIHAIPGWWDRLKMSQVHSDHFKKWLHVFVACVCWRFWWSGFSRESEKCF